MGCRMHPLRDTYGCKKRNSFVNLVVKSIALCLVTIFHKTNSHRIGSTNTQYIFDTGRTWFNKPPNPVPVVHSVNVAVGKPFIPDRRSPLHAYDNAIVGDPFHNKPVANDNIPAVGNIGWYAEEQPKVSQPVMANNDGKSSVIEPVDDPEFSKQIYGDTYYGIKHPSIPGTTRTESNIKGDDGNSIEVTETNWSHAPALIPVVTPEAPLQPPNDVHESTKIEEHSLQHLATITNGITENAPKESPQTLATPTAGVDDLSAQALVSSLHLDKQAILQAIKSSHDPNKPVHVWQDGAKPESSKPQSEILTAKTVESVQMEPVEMTHHEEEHHEIHTNEAPENRIPSDEGNVSEKVSEEKNTSGLVDAALTAHDSSFMANLAGSHSDPVHIQAPESIGVASADAKNSETEVTHTGKIFSDSMPVSQKPIAIHHAPAKDPTSKSHHHQITIDTDTGEIVHEGSITVTQSEKEDKNEKLLEHLNHHTDQHITLSHPVMEDAIHHVEPVDSVKNVEKDGDGRDLNDAKTESQQIASSILNDPEFHKAVEITSHPTVPAKLPNGECNPCLPEDIKENVEANNKEDAGHSIEKDNDDDIVENNHKVHEHEHAIEHDNDVQYSWEGAANEHNDHEELPHEHKTHEHRKDHGHAEVHDEEDHFKHHEKKLAHHRNLKSHHSQRNNHRENNVEQESEKESQHSVMSHLLHKPSYLIHSPGGKATHAIGLPSHPEDDEDEEDFEDTEHVHMRAHERHQVKGHRTHEEHDDEDSKKNNEEENDGSRREHSNHAKEESNNQDNEDLDSRGSSDHHEKESSRFNNEEGSDNSDNNDHEYEANDGGDRRDGEVRHHDEGDRHNDIESDEKDNNDENNESNYNGKMHSYSSNKDLKEGNLDAKSHGDEGNGWHHGSHLEDVDIEKSKEKSIAMVKETKYNENINEHKELNKNGAYHHGHKRYHHPHKQLINRKDDAEPPQKEIAERVERIHGSMDARLDQRPLQKLPNLGPENISDSEEMDTQQVAAKTDIRDNSPIQNVRKAVLKQLRHQTEVIDPPYMPHNDPHGDGLGEGIIDGPDISITGQVASPVSDKASSKGTVINGTESSTKSLPTSADSSARNYTDEAVTEKLSNPTLGSDNKKNKEKTHDNAVEKLADKIFEKVNAKYSSHEKDTKNTDNDIKLDSSEILKKEIDKYSPEAKEKNSVSSEKQAGLKEGENQERKKLDNEEKTNGASMKVKDIIKSVNDVKDKHDTKQEDNIGKSDDVSMKENNMVKSENVVNEKHDTKQEHIKSDNEEKYEGVQTKDIEKKEENLKLESKKKSKGNEEEGKSVNNKLDVAQNIENISNATSRFKSRGKLPPKNVLISTLMSLIAQKEDQADENEAGENKQAKYLPTPIPEHVRSALNQIHLATKLKENVGTEKPMLYKERPIKKEGVFKAGEKRQKDGASPTVSPTTFPTVNMGYPRPATDMEREIAELKQKLKDVIGDKSMAIKPLKKSKMIDKEDAEIEEHHEKLKDKTPTRKSSVLVNPGPPDEDVKVDHETVIKEKKSSHLRAIGLSETWNKPLGREELASKRGGLDRAEDSHHNRDESELKDSDNDDLSEEEKDDEGNKDDGDDNEEGGVEDDDADDDADGDDSDDGDENDGGSSNRMKDKVKLKKTYIKTYTPAKEETEGAITRTIIHKSTGKIRDKKGSTSKSVPSIDTQMLVRAALERVRQMKSDSAKKDNINVKSANKRDKVYQGKLSRFTNKSNRVKSVKSRIFLTEGSKGRQQ